MLLNLFAFQGKADLQKNFSKKMESWNYNSPHFIILRDNDGGDCKALKERLASAAVETGKPFHVRIVCQELEGWFLGDLNAIDRAYPTSSANQYAGKQKYRNPDSLNNASHLLETMTGVRGKVSRAQNISTYLTIDNNRSASFVVLANTLKKLAAQMS